jgi:hypothetical protein
MVALKTWAVKVRGASGLRNFIRSIGNNSSDTENGAGISCGLLRIMGLVNGLVNNCSNT